jgi:hypothetical protein
MHICKCWIKQFRGNPFIKHSVIKKQYVESPSLCEKDTKDDECICFHDFNGPEHKMDMEHIKCNDCLVALDMYTESSVIGMMANDFEKDDKLCLVLQSRNAYNIGAIADLAKSAYKAPDQAVVQAILSTGIYKE